MALNVTQYNWCYKNPFWGSNAITNDIIIEILEDLKFNDLYNCSSPQGNTVDLLKSKLNQLKLNLNVEISLGGNTKTFISKIGSNVDIKSAMSMIIGTFQYKYKNTFYFGDADLSLLAAYLTIVPVFKTKSFNTPIGRQLTSFYIAPQVMLIAAKGACNDFTIKTYGFLTNKEMDTLITILTIYQDHCTLGEDNNILKPDSRKLSHLGLYTKLPGIVDNVKALIYSHQLCNKKKISLPPSEPITMNEIKIKRGWVRTVIRICSNEQQVTRYCKDMIKNILLSRKREFLVSNNIMEIVESRKRGDIVVITCITGDLSFLKNPLIINVNPVMNDDRRFGEICLNGRCDFTCYVHIDNDKTKQLPNTLFNGYMNMI